MTDADRITRAERDLLVTVAEMLNSLAAREGRHIFVSSPGVARSGREMQVILAEQIAAVKVL